MIKIKDMHYGWIVVTACVLLSTYYSGAVLLGFTAVFEPLIHEFGWSYAQVSFVMSLRGMESGLLVPVAGILMNRWGPRVIIFSGTILVGIGLIGLSQVNSLLAFYAWFIVMGCGLSTATSALLMAAVTGWFKKNLGLATGITCCGVPIGGLLIPFVTRLIDTLGWREAIYYMGIGMWLIPLPLSLLIKSSPGSSMRLPKGKGIPASDAGNSDAGKSLQRPTKDMDEKEVLKSPLFWMICFCFICQYLPIGAVVVHIMPFFSSIGIDRATGSLLASLLPIITVIGRIGFGWMADRMGNKAMTTIAMIFMATGSLLPAFMSDGTMWIIVLFILIFGIGWGGAVPMLNGILCDFFGTRNIAAIIGFAGTAAMIGLMVGPLLAGWVYDQFGSYRQAWFLFAFISGSSAIIFTKFVCNRPLYIDIQHIK